ncbi:TPA: E3 binding domain-containing protein, partial [Streptococcus pneumoniae]
MSYFSVAFDALCIINRIGEVMADDKLRATPAARKLADDLGINLY